MIEYGFQGLGSVRIYPIADQLCKTNRMLYAQNKVQIGVWLEPQVIANCDEYATYFSKSRFGFINEALKL